MNDFSQHGYEIIRELGYNYTGGRVTYLATNTQTEEQVVIKEFQFAQSASWSGYDVYQQEIELLKRLNHPNIPKYLDSFPTEDGFCMVQEYMEAEPLSKPGNWSPGEIKQIALSILEILEYLQSFSPIIIHRDIKPENILIRRLDPPQPPPPLVPPTGGKERGEKIRREKSSELCVYLIDFGFARVGDGEVAASSAVKGTMGFMPPEQLFNRQLTAASDLYGLGATIISLLTGTDSTDISQLMDSDYKLHFRHLIPPMERGWLNWLEKMVEPNPKDRYSDAASARTALESLDVSTLPKLRLNKRSLELKGDVWGERLMGSIEVTNPIPKTILTGKWSVAPHPKDPPHTPYDHSWISFSEREFAGNHIECQIHVDTSKLEGGKTYHRQIVLETNSETERKEISLEIKTAPSPIFNLTLSFIRETLAVFSFFVFSGFLIANGKGIDGVTIFALLVFLFPTIVAADKMIMLRSQNSQVGEWKVIAVIIWAMFMALGVIYFISVYPGLSAIYKIADLFCILLLFLAPLIGAYSVSASWFSSFILYSSLGGISILFIAFMSVSHSFFHSLFLIGFVALLFPFLFLPYLQIGRGFYYIASRPLQYTIDNLSKMNFTKKQSGKIALLIFAFGITLSQTIRHVIYIYYNLDSFSLQAIIPAAAIAITALLLTGLPLLNLAIIQPVRLIQKYRKAKPNLIQTADERR